MNCKSNQIGESIGVIDWFRGEAIFRLAVEATEALLAADGRGGPEEGRPSLMKSLIRRLGDWGEALTYMKKEKEAEAIFKRAIKVAQAVHGEVLLDSGMEAHNAIWWRLTKSF